MLRLSLLILSLLFSAATYATPILPTPGVGVRPSIVGKWKWTRDTNNCTEIYDYRADGKLFVESGKEKTDNTYTIAFSPDANGFYKVTSTITKDYGGKDCADTTDDSTGQSSSNYVLFHPSGEMHVVCGHPSLDACFGPLRKLKD